MNEHRDEADGHQHGEHGHGHANDQGVKAMLRYLRWAPRMWRSEINTAVLELVAIEKGEHVVDIGAGMGAGAVLAARAGASVVAVEPTPFLRRILSVRRRFQRARSRMVVLDGAAERLPVEDGTVDAVWAVNTMHHWVDVDRGAAEIGRVLRPGGRVVLIDEDFEDDSHPDYARFGDHEEARHGHGFTMVDAEDMGEVFRAAGLVDVEAVKRRLGGRPVIALSARSAASSTT